jgi:plasmid replication initiation protein
VDTFGGALSKKEVVKASGAIQMTNKVSLLQRRTWNILLANAFDELLEIEEHKIEVKQLINILNFGSKNEEHLRNSLKDLTTTAVEWNILRKDKSAIWGVTTLLSQVEIKDGICTYAYSPALKKKLFQPSMYAKINLSIQNRFDSKHSLALYELCVDYYDVKRHKGETPFISVEDFRHLMGIDGSEYSEFKYLNKRTIIEPVIEINEKSDIYVEVEYKRMGRKVSFIKFLIKAHDSNKSQTGKVKSFITEEWEQKVQENTDNIVNFLTFYHISYKDIDYFLRNIDYTILEKTLLEIKAKIKTSIIHYPKSYILTVLNTLVGEQKENVPLYQDKRLEETQYTKKTLPHYLHFLIDDGLFDPQKGAIKLDESEEEVYINHFLEYGEEFWKRVFKKYTDIQEKNNLKRFQIAFEECRREENFIYHPLYQTLLESAELKENYFENKVYYLSLIIDLYWKILNKEILLEDALNRIIENNN